MDFRFDLHEIKQNILEKCPEWYDFMNAVAFIDSPSADPAGYSGSVVYYNKRRMRQFSQEGQEFLIAQQLLHIQLAHRQRGRSRDRKLWDIACASVAAELLMDCGFEPPAGIVRIKDAKGLSAEELYDVLREKVKAGGYDPAWGDVTDRLDASENDEDGSDGADTEQDEANDPGSDGNDYDRDDWAEHKRAEYSGSVDSVPAEDKRSGDAADTTFSDTPFQNSDTRRQSGGLIGAQNRDIEDPGLAQAVAGLSDLLEPSLQLDYDWFPADRIRDGILKEQFKPYPVPHAEILLDTSASIDEDLLRAFVRGVKDLLREDAVVRVGCFDTEFYGFQEIHSEKDISSLEIKGAGGTNFETAVRAFTGDAETKIVFTDGYADMPVTRCDAIWLVYSDTPVDPPGGRVLYVKKPEEIKEHEVNFLIT